MQRKGKSHLYLQFRLQKYIKTLIGPYTVIPKYMLRVASTCTPYLDALRVHPICSKGLLILELSILAFQT